MPNKLYIRALNANSSKAVLFVGNRQFPCLIGKSGRSFLKREGDSKSPRGFWKIETLFYRPDKTWHVNIGKVLRKSDGWCDDRTHRSYNSKISLPFSGRHEELWRDDSAYDIVITTNHNTKPKVRGHGSAIFLHLIKEGATCTEGCIALREGDLRKVLAAIGKQTYLVI